MHIREVILFHVGRGGTNRPPYSIPTAFRPSSIFSEKSVPSQGSAAGVVRNATARATQSGEMWASQAIWLTGLIPEARIALCMAVATVPGERPTTRTPDADASL